MRSALHAYHAALETRALGAILFKYSTMSLCHQYRRDRKSPWDCPQHVCVGELRERCAIKEVNTRASPAAETNLTLASFELIVYNYGWWI